MSSTPQGIRNFSKMTEIDKAYLVKLLGTMAAAVIAGIISGVTHTEGGGTSTGLWGWFIWLIASIGFTILIKFKYDLGDWNNIRIFRHGIFVGLLTYIYLWVTVFNYIYL